MYYGIVYKHTNKINGKVYIGQTTQDPERRWRKTQPSFPSYRNNQYLLDSLKKYGWINFDSEVLASGQSKEDLDWLEEFFITYYNCLQPHGYNSRVGGNKGKLCEETKRKIGDANRGRKMSAPVWNKKQYIIIDGVKHKECSACKIPKILEHFGLNKTRGDGIHGKCKTCHAEYAKKYPYKPVSKERVKQSYKLRSDAHSKRMKEHFSDPEAKRKFSLSFGGYRGIHVETNEELIFECGHDAKAAGFIMSSLSGSLNNPNRTYRGYRWTKISPK